MNDAALTQLTNLVEAAVEPVQAGVARKKQMREELLAHLRAAFEEEMARLGDEQAALERTAARFGNTAELSRQLQEAVPASFINHNRLYNAMLVVFCFYIAGGMTLLAALLRIPLESRPDTQWPDWSLPAFAVLNGAYLLTMTVTLVLRLVRPMAGKRLTRVMNLLFLLGPPLGTALGIYGLWKVDQDLDVRASS